MNFSYGGVTDRNILIEDEFTFPSMSKQVSYRESAHASYRRKIRMVHEPYTFTVPLIIKNQQNTLSRDDVIRDVSAFLFSEKPEVFKLVNSDWYVVGEFNGPYYVKTVINGFVIVEVDFTSSYPYKFYDGERTQTANKTVTISTKSQIPTTPLIELTGLTGDDVQVSISDDSFRRIRLSGNVPSNLTIDIQNERIYETNSGVDRIQLLRIDSAFEDFKIKHGDVVVLTNSGDNARARLTYKELLL
jgi:phage-related protein